MAAFHQMGNDSWNLIDEESLERYAGLVLSPVNDKPHDTAKKVAAVLKGRGELDIILDPQFYKPGSDRGCIVHWDYFSKDVDTTDLSNLEWWKARIDNLVAAAKLVGATSICSPAMLPKQFDDDYYRLTSDVADYLLEKARAQGLGVLVTVIARLPDLSRKGRAEAIAGIITSTNVSRAYIVLFDDIEPRMQRTDVDELAGMATLLKLLEGAAVKALVAFSGLDMVLWKAFGASDVATGKFFNLRRFVPTRWEEAGERGSVVPYFTDGDLVTWLREADLKLLENGGVFDRASAAPDEYSQKILEIIDAGQGKPWVAIGWRQYLAWFARIEEKISNDRSVAKAILKHADALWAKVEKDEVYLLDRSNNGSWIRPWLNALTLGK